MVTVLKHYQSKSILIKQSHTFLKDIMNNLNKSNTLKIQLTMSINFMSSKDTDEELLIN